MSICASGQGFTVGETSRRLGTSATRIDEHKKEYNEINQQKFTRSQKQDSKQTNNKSAVTDHAGTENHVIDWEGRRLVATWRTKIVQKGSAKPSGSNAHNFMN